MLFRSGDTVTYTITVKNTGNVTLKNITVVDDLTGDTWTIEELAVGATSEELTATYIVTEADLLAHKIENIATATTTNPDDPTEEVKDDDDETVETEKVVPGIEVTKTADKTENVKLGEVVTYTIVVKNTGNVTLKNINVNDDLTGEDWVIAELPVGKAEIFTTTYTITSEDILLGIVKNVAVAETTNPDDPDEPVKGQDEEEVDPEPIDTTMEVIKTSTYDGETVGLGEVISYTITVTNKGNVPFTNVVVVDEMTGDEWTIETLNVGETKTFETSYTVTSDDIKAGKVLNVVTAKGDPIPDPDPIVPPHIPEDDDDEEDPTDPIDTTMEVIKTSDKDGAEVALGEVITYTITVTNKGNVPFTNVKVVDEMTNDEWVIAELAVGATETFTATYTVTSDDILNGVVINSVVGKGDPIPDPDPIVPPHIPEDDDDEEDPTEPINGTVVIEKVANKKNNVELNERIIYTITVENKGNVPMNNVKVDDELTGMHEVIDVLNVGEVKTFETEVFVTQAHVDAGRVLNVATVKADPIPDPDDPSTPIIPEDEDEEEVITKNNEFRVSVRYWIEEVNGKKAAPDFTNKYHTGDTYHVTSPRVPGYTPDVQVVKGVVGNGDVVIDVIYTADDYKLTINYIYENGEQAAPKHEETLKIGDKYEVTSPSISGYWPSTKVVKGKMPARDLTVTVIYKQNGNYITINDYNDPLGLGNVNLNAGDCFE